MALDYEAWSAGAARPVTILHSILITGIPDAGTSADWTASATRQAALHYSAETVENRAKTPSHSLECSRIERADGVCGEWPVSRSGAANND